MAVSKEEFLEIIENYLTTDSEGNIIITDEKMAHRYKEYLEQYASSDVASLVSNVGCVNIYCPPK